MRKVYGVRNLYGDAPKVAFADKEAAEAVAEALGLTVAEITLVEPPGTGLATAFAPGVRLLDDAGICGKGAGDE